MVQPYVPHYRVPFFHLLHGSLAAIGVDLSVAAPRVQGTQALRGDAAALPFLLNPAGRARSLAVAGTKLQYFGTAGLIRNADLVVVPASAALWDSVYAVLRPGRHGQPVGMWGHIANYVKPANRIDQAIERLLMRRATHIMAYTESGRQYALDSGVDERRATALGNSVDTESLSAAFAQVSSKELLKFRMKHGLRASRIFAYIGGLDADKGVGFLVDVLHQLEQSGADVQILVGGRGSEEERLRPYSESGMAVLLGYVKNREKAIIGHLVHGIVAPGRIGLVAVDALTLGVPVLARPFGFHAPEIEYLQEGSSVHTGPGSPSTFAAWLMHTQFARHTQEPPLLADMVIAFVNAIEQMQTDSRSNFTRRTGS